MQDKIIFSHIRIGFRMSSVAVRTTLNLIITVKNNSKKAKFTSILSRDCIPVTFREAIREP